METTPQTLSYWPLALFIGLTVAAAATGAIFQPGAWYASLEKPSWTPPNGLFGPAWTVILGLAGWSLYLAWQGAETASDRMIVATLFCVNFVLHFAWSPLFFKAKRPDWALRENVGLWLSVLALVVVLPSYSSLAGLLNLPYLAWVSFAFVLNWKIVQLNGPFGREVTG